MPYMLLILNEIEIKGVGLIPLIMQSEKNILIQNIITLPSHINAKAVLLMMYTYTTHADALQPDDHVFIFQVSDLFARVY